MFRQAMRSPVIMFHVVPSSMKAHYEQLSHAERNPAYASGRFSPDSLTGSTVSGIDHTQQRMSRHGSQTQPHSHPHPHPQTHPDQTEGYPPLTHPAVSAAKPPTGHAHSPQRGLTSTPTVGYTKKVGRRLNIQLKKGEVKKSPCKNNCTSSKWERNGRFLNLVTHFKLPLSEKFLIAIVEEEHCSPCMMYYIIVFLKYHLVLSRGSGKISHSCFAFFRLTKNRDGCFCMFLFFPFQLNKQPISPFLAHQKQV